MADWMDELERLAELRDKGLLSDEEFEVKRQEILNSPTETAGEDKNEGEPATTNDTHDYGDHDYDVLFPDGEYRYDYSLDELLAMSHEDLQELANWLKKAGYPEATPRPDVINKYLRILIREENKHTKARRGTIFVLAFFFTVTLSVVVVVNFGLLFYLIMMPIILLAFWGLGGLGHKVSSKGS